MASSKTPTKSSSPQNIDGVDKDKISKGDVIINKSDGTTQTIKDAPLYNGAFYDPDTGDIMGDTHGPEGIYDKEQYDKDYYRNEDGKPTGVFTEKPKKEEQKKETASSSYDDDDDDYDDDDDDYYEPEPSPPPPPPKVEWSEPFPTFSSDYKMITRYIYHLGVDEAIFSNVVHEENSVCVTPLIEIGKLDKEEYLMLEAEFKGNVEFYILDGDKTIDILPVNQTKIENEKMFFGLLPRFIVDDQYDVIVKRNDVTIDEDYKTILNNKLYWGDNTVYNMSYVPIVQNSYRPIEERIQLKIIMRGISSVNYLAFRYYGDNYYIN